MDLRFIEIPKIENDILLEEMCRDILKQSQNFSIVNMHGRPGQKQDGIDVFAMKNDSNNWIGAQCKVRSTNSSFSKQDLLDEVNAAKNFNPKISEYYLYTTLDRDNTTQQFLREINTDLRTSGNFTFEIKFWVDIAETLKTEQYHPVYFKYYKKFFRDNTSIGHCIGKLMNLNLGFVDKLDTHYELILGKVPMTNAKTVNVDYYRGTYFIINLHHLKMEFFTPNDVGNPPYCFTSDIEAAFENQIDRFRILKWLNSINNLDDFIYNDDYTNEFYLSDEERKEFDKLLTDDDE